MRRLLIFLLAVPALGQSIVTVTAGALSCGAIERSPNQVQTYCFVGSTVVHNTIDTLAPATVVTYHRGTDAVDWLFRLNGSVIEWQAAVNDVLRTGKLTFVFGSPPPTGQ